MGTKTLSPFLLATTPCSGSVPTQNRALSFPLVIANKRHHMAPPYFHFSQSLNGTSFANVTSLRCFSLQLTVQLFTSDFTAFSLSLSFALDLVCESFPSPILLIHDFQDENYIWSNPLLILEAGKIALKLLNVSNGECSVKKTHNGMMKT